MMLKSSNYATTLGIITDSDLNSDSHIKATTKLAYNHLKNIAKIKEVCLKLIQKMFIFSRLDYCNSVFTGFSKQQSDSCSSFKMRH